MPMKKGIAAALMASVASVALLSGQVADAAWFNLRDHSKTRAENFSEFAQGLQKDVPKIAKNLPVSETKPFSKRLNLGLIDMSGEMQRGDKSKIGAVHSDFVVYGIRGYDLVMSEATRDSIGDIAVYAPQIAEQHVAILTPKDILVMKSGINFPNVTTQYAEDHIEAYIDVDATRQRLDDFITNNRHIFPELQEMSDEDYEATANSIINELLSNNNVSVGLNQFSSKRNGGLIILQNLDHINAKPGIKGHYEPNLDLSLAGLAGHMVPHNFAENGDMIMFEGPRGDFRSLMAFVLFHEAGHLRSMGDYSTHASIMLEEGRADQIAYQSFDQLFYPLQFDFSFKLAVQHARSMSALLANDFLLQYDKKVPLFGKNKRVLDAVSDTDDADLGDMFNTHATAYLIMHKLHEPNSAERAVEGAYYPSMVNGILYQYIGKSYGSHHFKNIIKAEQDTITTPDGGVTVKLQDIGKNDYKTALLGNYIANQDVGIHYAAIMAAAKSKYFERLGSREAQSVVDLAANGIMALKPSFVSDSLAHKFYSEMEQDLKTASPEYIKSVPMPAFVDFYRY